MSNKIIVNENICKGCALCTSACPKKIMKINREKLNEKGYNPVFVVDMERCIACSMCAIICPDSAIRIEKEDE